ncbi:MAG TPA: ATP-binding protein [Chloroflexia bacterium]|nr:ATP-binding protein [Chloroflexia bacterium]
MKLRQRIAGFRWYGLGVKLFLSYLAIVALVLLVLLQTTDFVAPANFAAQRGRMLRAGAGAGFGMNSENRGGPGSFVANAEALLTQAFQQSLNQSLLIAGSVALLVAVLISLFVSWQLIRPVRRLADASQRIAAGHYGERVVTGSKNHRRRDELGELAASFNEMARALEENEQRRLELVGDVAHELRTPVSTLQGYLEGLLDGVIEPDEKTWAKLYDEASRMRRLIDDLQELSRAEAHQVSFKIAPVDPLKIATVAAERLVEQFKEKGLTFTSLIPEGLPPVQADFERAVQVLTNLLTNALRYTPPSGAVRLCLRQTSKAVEFKVSDTGIGIAPEHLPHLFERFYRVDKSRSRALGGSGIGLTISRALVEGMGGHLEATSPGPGQGSTFSFTLPRAA